MTELSDAKLVELAQNGNLEAVGELYDRYWLRIFHYVRAKVYNIQLAQDLTGEVFLRMVEHLPRYQVMEGILFSTWLYRIAHNLVISHWQKENAYQLVPLEAAANSNNHHDKPLRIAEEQWEQTHIQQCLARIDEVQREVIILRFYAGLSLKEVAAALDKTVGAVKSLQRRGLMTLVAVMKSMP
ncbi:MAG: RNA polymerase sigma factor [Anaerolineae bacterium]|nr:RNA polymerase sigma factor [Anaerolineae bacterium]